MNHIPDNLPQRLKLPHTIPSWVREDAIFFITICCTPSGANHLCSDSVSAVIWESLDFRQKRGDWYVHLWLLMPDHLHALVSFPREAHPTRVLAGWKEIIAKKIKIQWQRDFFDHRLRSDESHAEKAHYIRQNPVRKGLVAHAADWKYAWEPPH